MESDDEFPEFDDVESEEEDCSQEVMELDDREARNQVWLLVDSFLQKNDPRSIYYIETVLLAYGTSWNLSLMHVELFEHTCYLVTIESSHDFSQRLMLGAYQKCQTAYQIAKTEYMDMLWFVLECYRRYLYMRQIINFGSDIESRLLTIVYIIIQSTRGSVELYVRQYTSRSHKVILRHYPYIIQGIGMMWNSFAE